MTRWPSSLILVLALGAAAEGGHGQTPPDRDEPTPGSVLVEMTGLEHTRGQLLVALFRSPRGFPDEAKHAHARNKVRPRKPKTLVSFEQVPAGRFAIAVHHDEDGDFDMDTNFFGIPAEPYGASRDARNLVGPPSYGDAVLRLKPGERKRVRIRVSTHL